jgi:hypothetical protein
MAQIELLAACVTRMMCKEILHAFKQRHFMILLFCNQMIVYLAIC